jgi:hypothetical protein
MITGRPSPAPRSKKVSPDFSSASVNNLRMTRGGEATNGDMYIQTSLRSVYHKQTVIFVLCFFNTFVKILVNFDAEKTLLPQSARNLVD